MAPWHVFPAGPGGACHPLNIVGFDIDHAACRELYWAPDRTWAMAEGWWKGELRAHWELAREAWNCSSVQECGLAKLFLYHGQYMMPGFKAHLVDYNDAFWM